MRERETIEKGAVDSRNIGVALEQMKLLHVSLLRDRPFFSIGMEQNAVKNVVWERASINNTNITCSIRCSRDKKNGCGDFLVRLLTR